MADDERPENKPIRARITLRAQDDDIVASVSDEEGDISVHRAEGANLLSPLERAQLAEAVRLAVEEIVGEAIEAGSEAIRAPVVMALRDIADRTEADAPENGDDSEATVLRLEPDDEPRQDAASGEDTDGAEGGEVPGEKPGGGTTPPD